MSLAKAVLKGIRDKECKRFALQERPPVPYVPEKDPVQEMVSSLNSDQSLKTTMGKMCPHQWQDQYNLQEKGITPMDMHSLQASLKAIERMCTSKKAHVQSGKKASQKNKAGAKQPSTGATKQAHKKVHFEKSYEL